jgi:hypothetical protein
MSKKNVIRITLDQDCVEATFFEKRRSALTVQKYKRFKLPANLYGANAAAKPADIAGFIADSLKQEGFGDAPVELFIGNGIGFYTGYSINSDNKKLISERRSLHIEQTFGSEAKQYIIEERKKSKEGEDGFRTYTIYGVQRAYLETLIKSLKARGFRIRFAGSSYTPIEETKNKPFASYDYRYGGTQKRRLARAMNALLAGAFAILILLAMMLPAQELLLERQVTDEKATLESAGYAMSSAKLAELRTLKTQHKSYEPGVAFLTESATDFGALLKDSLGRELLKDAEVLEAVYDKQTDLILDVIIPDEKAFEQIRSRINDERNISITEAAPPEKLDPSPGQIEPKWHVQIHVTSFDVGNTGSIGSTGSTGSPDSTGAANTTGTGDTGNTSGGVS